MSRWIHRRNVVSSVFYEDNTQVWIVIVSSILFPLPLPVLLDSLVLPLRAGPDGLRSRGKMSGQQVEVDTCRRHDGSQSRHGAHVVPRWNSLFTGQTPLETSGFKRRGRQSGKQSRRVVAQSEDTEEEGCLLPGKKWLLTFRLCSADGSHGAATFLREKTMLCNAITKQRNPPLSLSPLYIIFNYLTRRGILDLNTITLVFNSTFCVDSCLWRQWICTYTNGPLEGGIVKAMRSLWASVYEMILTDILQC